MGDPFDLKIEQGPVVYSNSYKLDYQDQSIINIIVIDIIIMLFISLFKIDEVQLKKIMHLIESGKEQGANLMTGGERVGDKGYFVAPTVFADVQDDMTIATEEVNIKIIFDL